MARLRTFRLLMLGLGLAFTAACGSDHTPEPESETERDPSGQGTHNEGQGEVDVTPGATEFVSADARAGEAVGAPGANSEESAGAAGMAAADSSLGNSDPRTVEEGDIYRVLDNGTILNLNAYRGFQVIDVSDPSDPAIIGSYSVQGQPEEMYVIGDRALILLNNWQGYYGTRDDVHVDLREGGLIVELDLSTPTAPHAVDSVFVEGYIQRSRVVRNDTVGALYVASSAGEEVVNEQGYSEWIQRAVVTSFDIGGDRLDRKDELDLGGYVSDIQATPEALLVASNDWRRADDRSSVAAIDISDPNGAMVQGDSVLVAGFVGSQFNMDLYNGVLRVVSTQWGRSTNQVETFDASDLSELSPLDACTFGAGQDLYATLFLENKAFFVTYERRDPFHAFSIADDGLCQEQAEFVVSGWNDFFRPVAGSTRLIGIGQDDQDSARGPAVSLYDITDLTNSTPLLARASTDDLTWSWSEASWDHRAFSVLENAVSVSAPDETPETGLVLLPYQGEFYDEQGHYEYRGGVQLFTFSDSTVTARASLDHDTAVRRAFLADDDVAAALSEESLSLFDHSDPDAPELLSELPLAPNYGRVLQFGDHLVRLRRPSYGYYYYYDLESGNRAPDAMLEVIDADGDPNSDQTVAEIAVPADASLLKAGELLVSATYRVRGDTDQWPYDYDTTVELYDFSDPAHPAKVGEAEADDLTPTSLYYGGYGWYGGYGVIGCGLGGYWFSGNQDSGTIALGDAVVFTTSVPHEERLGIERYCSYWPRGEQWCDDGNCERVLTGGRECVSPDGGLETCNDYFSVCSVEDGEWSCEDVEFEEIEDELQHDCWDNERYRYWSSYRFRALDVSDPEDPRFGDSLEMPERDESVRVLPLGEAIYYTYRRPVEVEDDPRGYVKYYFRKIDFSDPLHPDVSDAVNIPGELIAVEGDKLYTRDIRWGEETADTYVHELSFADGLAHLEASYSFAGRDVRNVTVSDGNVLISHDVVYPNYWSPAFEAQIDEQTTKLTILSQDGLARRSEVDVDRWSTLEAAHAGRALYTVPGGLMIFDVADPEHPQAQAFFHSNGWPEQILFEGNNLLVAAGRYGIHEFDIEERNLLEE